MVLAGWSRKQLGLVHSEHQTAWASRTRSSAVSLEVKLWCMDARGRDDNLPGKKAEQKGQGRPSLQAGTLE